MVMSFFFSRPGTYSHKLENPKFILHLAVFSATLNRKKYYRFIYKKKNTQHTQTFMEIYSQTNSQDIR